MHHSGSLRNVDSSACWPRWSNSIYNSLLDVIEIFYSTSSAHFSSKLPLPMRYWDSITCGFGIPLHFSNYIWHHSGGRSGSDDVAITKTKIRMKKIHRKQRENNVCCKRRNIVLLWPPYSYFEHHKPQPQRNTRFINIHKTIKELEHTINFFNIIILSLT